MSNFLTEEQKHKIMTTQHQLPTTQVSNRFAGLNILGLVADTSACGYYRVINPLHMLKMHGANVNYGSNHSMEQFLKYDIIVAPRQHNPVVYEILRFVAWEGKLIIYEIDDDLDAVLPTSPAFISYHQGSPDIHMVNKVMQNCHGVITYKPELAKWYYRNNRNVAIIENFIDFSFRDWNAEVTWDDGYAVLKALPVRKPAEWEGKTVIGYSFGTTHNTDMHLIGKDMKAILEEREDVLFAIYTSPNLSEELVKTYNLPKDKVVLLPARHFMDHPTGLHGMDIQLAPIECNQFNLAKSFLKCLEGMAVGSAMIASNVGPYARFDARHPGSIIKVGQGRNCRSSWKGAIDELLNDKDKLAKMQTEGRQLVYDNYSLEKNFVHYPAAWAAIRQKVHDGQVGPPDKLKEDSYYRSYKSVQPNDRCLCQSGLKSKQCCKNAWG